MQTEKATINGRITILFTFEALQQNNKSSQISQVGSEKNNVYVNFIPIIN